MFDPSEIAGVFNSIDLHKSIGSLDEHKSRIQKQDLSYSDLLGYAALYSSSCELLEFENENLKKLLDGLQRVVSAQSELFDAQKSAHDELTEIVDLHELATTTRRFLEGQIAGRDTQKKIMARNGASAKKASDPKQIAKQYVFSSWQVWQEEPDRYKSKAEFAKTMLKQGQCKCLESQKKIEDWCREWGTSNGTLPAE